MSEAAAGIWESTPVSFARGLVTGVFDGGRDLVTGVGSLLWHGNAWLWDSGFHPADLRPDRLARMWSTVSGVAGGIWDAATHPADTWAAATHLVGAIWGGVCDWAAGAWDTLLHGTPEEVGHLVGRVGFEVAATVVPVSKIGKLGALVHTWRGRGAARAELARLAAKTETGTAAFAYTVALAQTRQMAINGPELSALRRIAWEERFDRAQLDALVDEVGDLRVGRTRFPAWYRWREVTDELAYRADALPPGVVFEQGFRAPGRDAFLYTHLQGWGSSAYVTTTRNYTEGAYVIRVRHGIDVEHGVTGPASPMRDLGSAREIAVAERIAPEDVLGLLRRDPSAPSGVRFVPNPNATVDRSLRVADDAGMRLHGAFDYPHELDEAARLVRFEGGAEVYATGATPGIEGFLVRDGTTELVPFSLKNFGNRHDWTRVPETIEENHAIIQREGYRGVIFYAQTPQLTARQVTDVVTPAIEHLPREGTFSRLVFEASDGHVVIDRSGTSIAVQ